MLRTRLPGIRPPRLSYANVTATLALVIATSMGGAYAHGMITSADIRNNAVKARHIDARAVKTSDLARNAVTTDRIRARAVTRGKLAPSAQTTIIGYTLPGHDFTTPTELVWSIPGDLDADELARSIWHVQARSGDFWYQLPGRGPGGASTYRVYTGVQDRLLVIGLVDGAGDNFDQVRAFRSVPTHTVSDAFAVQRRANPLDE